MSLLPVLGFGLKVGHLVWMLGCWLVSLMPVNLFVNGGNMESKSGLLGDGSGKMLIQLWEKIFWSSCKLHHPYYQYIGSKRVTKKWCGVFSGIWVVLWVIIATSIFWYISSQAIEKRKETLTCMCDERARMLQDQFNVSMNHVQAMSILIATFHHGKNPSAIDQRTFARYTERTAFERPLTSWVAYAVRVFHSEREQFEKQQGWTIKRMDTLDKNRVHKNDYSPSALEPSPVQEEYAPVIFAQDTISHVVSIDLLSGKEDRENVLRARVSGKGVLTAPFRLLKTNRLGVILTFAVYKTDLPSNATPEDMIQATDGYLGGVFDIESLVEKLLEQLASKQTILVNVYDISNESHPISMYGSNLTVDDLEHVSALNFGDPFRKHEMRCRFKHKAPLPWLAISTAIGVLVIALLIGHIFNATFNRIAKVEDDYHEMVELKKRAEAADVAKSQFLATVSHEIRTPMNGVLGMLHMLMDTDLDVTQQEYVRTAQASGKALVSIINEVLDQAKIESGKLELEAVRFDLRAILDEVLSLFSDTSRDKGVELAVYISDEVPEMLVGDPGRFRQILTNLIGNSIKFTEKGHIFVTVHLVEEVFKSVDVQAEFSSGNTLSGFPVADRQHSWEGLSAEGSSSIVSSSSLDRVKLIVSVEDTGSGIPVEAQPRVFTPFMQVGPSISRIHGGTGIGLSISKCLVGLMNGEIRFVSIPKIGSTFTFTVVFNNASSASDGYKSQMIKNQSRTVSSEFQGMRAYVVDPRPLRANVTRYHIQRLGIHVDVVTDLNQCLSKISSGSTRTDLILLEHEVWHRDLGISSLFVSNLTRIDPSAVPKIFLLASSARYSNADAATSGFYTPSVITKPLRASMLAASLQREMGVGGKGNTRNGELPSASLHSLLLGRKILIVDDNDVNLKVAAGALKKFGAEVVHAKSGKEAIKYLKPPHSFDACFMDIQMPEMDGFEATRRIRQMEKNVSMLPQRGEVTAEVFESASKWHLPILAMTADVINATHEECLSCGMDGYVSKPFEAEQLYREVSRCLQASSGAKS